MKPAKIFRIQDKKGRGPWKPGFSQKWVKSRPDHKKLLPWFDEFGALGMTAGMHTGCGCRTKTGLRRWFICSEYDFLKKHGYRAVSMMVERVIAESDTQIFFERLRPLKRNVILFDLY